MWAWRPWRSREGVDHVLPRRSRTDGFPVGKQEARGTKPACTCCAAAAGWKYIHGDVFRFPPFLNLFCAVVGTGTQILVLAFAIFGISLLGTYHPYNRGALLTSCVVLYALTAGAPGAGRGVGNWPGGGGLGVGG